MGKPEWAIPGLLFSDTYCIFCTVLYVPRSPTSIPKYGTLVILTICAANALVSLAIGALKGANLGRGPDLV